MRHQNAALGNACLHVDKPARRTTAPGGMENQFMSRAALIDVYISGLNLATVAVVSDGRRCRVAVFGSAEDTGEPEPGETVRHRFYFKPSRADLVLMTIGKEGVTGKPPAALAALIERAAAMLGAPYRTPDELRRIAEQAVVEVQARVAALNQSGGLKQINKQYKSDRLAQIARAEKAMP
jgi:hypothetical protein